MIWAVLPLKDKLKLIGLVVCIVLAGIFIGYRGCNKATDENMEEQIEIIEIDIPTPSEFDRICVQISGEPCPRFSE
jgi:hypothetical protein